MKQLHVTAALAGLTFGIPQADAGSCYADREQLAKAMAIVVASAKCPGYAQALFGETLDVFIRKTRLIDQTTGGCLRERMQAVNQATDRLLSDRAAFCGDVEATLASDDGLAQALREAGARKAP